MEWKQIEETNYSVSNTGDVRNDTTGKILSKRKYTLGYNSVSLGRGKQFLVHRLVAQAFLPPCPDGCVVDHINRIKTDNRVENLRWATKSQNAMNNDKNNISFVVNLTRNGVRFRKSFKTLSEAERYRDMILETNPIFEN